MIAPDPLHLIIAFGPLAMYLLPLGLFNLSRRPMVTTGTRDMAALGVGISGFVLAGPMELFMPEATAETLHGMVWVLLLALYSLLVTLAVLLMRPKLVIYNIRLDQLRPILSEVVTSLDNDARWAGDNVVLPNLCVQLHIEQSDLLRTAELIANGTSPGWQSQDVYVGWRKLEIALRQALGDLRVSPNPSGIGFVATSLFFIGMIAFFLVRMRPSIAHALWEMLRL